MALGRIYTAIGASILVAASACNPTDAGNSQERGASTGTRGASGDPISTAMSAAPASIARGATIASVQGDGRMTVLRKGTNSFTCVPGDAGTPGGFPMCMDATGASWMAAWRDRRPPPDDRIGVIYMLSVGAGGAPARMGKAALGCIRNGPHVMIVGIAPMLKYYPGKAPGDDRAPWVMSAGSPYAHLIVAVGPT